MILTSHAFRVDGEARATRNQYSTMKKGMRFELCAATTIRSCPRVRSLSDDSKTVIRLLVVVALTILAITVSDMAVADDRPNFVVIISDDQRSDALGKSGHPVIKTPNIDALAGRGVHFISAFVTSPICTPSRTSMLTGQYERKHGVTFGSRSALSMNAFAKTYPAQIRAQGYATAYIGKNHTPVGRSKRGFGYASGKFESGFDYWYGNHRHMGFYPKERHEIYRSSAEDTQIEILRDAALNFIRGDTEQFVRTSKESAAVPGQPFLMIVSFNVPHANGVGSMEQRASDPGTYKNLYRDREELFPIPETYIAYGDIRKPKIPNSVYRNDYIDSYRYVRTPKTLIEHSLREAQTITGIDAMVGDLVRELEVLGLAKNTIIIYLSDHGVLHGEHGLGGKTLFYEEAIRIPFIIFDPRNARGKKSPTENSLVLNLDLHPTLLDLAGLPIPAGTQGRSLRPLMRGEIVPWRNDFLLENLFTGQGYPRIEGVRSERYKYIRYFDPGSNPSHLESLTATIDGEQPVFEELYDLHSDPLETANLANMPEHAGTLNTLRTRCDSLLVEAIGGVERPDTILE
ncbi:MAG: sulfatase-like hydrolase/transferase [Pseudomonadota bacterium]